MHCSLHQQAKNPAATSAMGRIKHEGVSAQISEMIPQLSARPLK
jgi:secreted PhoX family phosphatase